MNFDLVFITTFINEQYINKFLYSVVDNNKTINILIVLLNQTNNKIAIENKNDRIKITEIMINRHSLSAARNIGIKFLIDNNVKFEFIQFPDDDSTYDKSYFARFRNITEKNENYLIDVYGLGTDELYLPNNLVNNTKIDSIYPHVAMSVNLLVNYETFMKVRYFDELMGVGTMYGAGEDSDYFLRCVQESGALNYTKDLWNFHPQFESKHKQLNLSVLIDKYKSYGKGVIYLHYKHKMFKRAILLCVYAILGSFYALFYKLDIKLFLARLFAFWYRSITFIALVVKRKK